MMKSISFALGFAFSIRQLPNSQAFTVGPQSSSVGKFSNKQPPLPVSTLANDFVSNNALTPSEQFDMFDLSRETFSPDLYIEKQQSSLLTQEHEESFPDYKSFATKFPLLNNMMIASGKAAVADLFAQTVIAQSGLDAVDWHRTFLFCLFGAFYQGGFQYLYQVNLFSKLFDVEKFTSQPWAEKLRDGPGLRSLAIQVMLDLMIMSSIYLPTYYTFKASIFSSTIDPTMWLLDGFTTYESHFCRDETDLLRVWLPADLLCFSVPLILRLPLRQVISLFYTAYLSSSSFGN